ncbi:MAG: DUF58 domain-containing protein [Chloroflexota bacterium]|nr:DUF58 domain-containing protein [Chloroflexota bacterium]
MSTGLLRRLQLLFIATVLVVAAFSTGISFLFFLVYLVAGLLLASYVYTRYSLSGLRARFDVLNAQLEVGEILRTAYRVENGSRFAKPVVEFSNDANLPTGLPGRAIGLAARSTRQWIAKVPMMRRGTFRIGALRIRSGDPFGFFSREMVVGEPTSVTVFPRVYDLQHWRMPTAAIDGNVASRQRTESSSPLVNGIRPYVHGDALNRVHWLSSARHQELLVKEFELEQAADLWLVLDLDRAAHAGVGLEASSEIAISAAASIALRTLSDNRAVGIAVSARRTQLIQPDRGTRMAQKVLHLLANVEADGTRPLAQMILPMLPRLRRGMTICIITGSTDRAWVRPLAALRRRGISSLAVILDRASFAGRADDQSRAMIGAVRHALAEYGVGHHVLHAGDDLASVLSSGAPVRV